MKGLRYLLIHWINCNKQESNRKHFSDKVNCNTWTVYCELVLQYVILHCATDLYYFIPTKNDIIWSLSHFCWKILQCRLRYVANAKNVVCTRCGNALTIFLFLRFSLLYLSVLMHAVFALFLVVTIDLVYVNFVRLKYIDSSCHFLELNYGRLNLNFLKLKQLFIDSDI